jgi:hypothetical protein
MWGFHESRGSRQTTHFLKYLDSENDIQALIFAMLCSITHFPFPKTISASVGFQAESMVFMSNEKKANISLWLHLAQHCFCKNL